jgi:hypothetical protein
MGWGGKGGGQFVRSSPLSPRSNHPAILSVVVPARQQQAVRSDHPSRRTIPGRRGRGVGRGAGGMLAGRLGKRESEPKSFRADASAETQELELANCRSSRSGSPSVRVVRVGRAGQAAPARAARARQQQVWLSVRPSVVAPAGPQGAGRAKRQQVCSIPAVDTY